MGNLKALKSHALIAAGAARMTKDREIYIKLRSCLIKSVFESETAARDNIAKDQKAYRCGDCGKWHRAHIAEKELLNYVRSVGRKRKAITKTKRAPKRSANSVPAPVRKKSKSAEFVKRLSRSRSVWKVRDHDREVLVVYSNHTKNLVSTQDGLEGGKVGQGSDGRNDNQAG